MRIERRFVTVDEEKTVTKEERQDFVDNLHRTLSKSDADTFELEEFVTMNGFTLYVFKLTWSNEEDKRIANLFLTRDGLI